MAAVRIDRGNKLRNRHVALICDLLQPLPECIFEAHAGLVTGDNNRAFGDRRFHPPPPTLSSSTAGKFGRAFVTTLSLWLKEMRRCIRSNQTAATPARLRTKISDVTHPRS